MKEHLCIDREWEEGGVETCPMHNHDGRRQRPIRHGKNARRKMDREVGTVGQDRGGYING